MNTIDQDDLRRAREAAMWHIRLQCEGPSCYVLFSAWIMESSRHIEAFLRVTAISSRLDGLDPRREIDVAALIAEAKECVVPLTPEKPDAVGAFATSDTRRAEQAKPKTARNWSLAGVAAVLLIVGAIFVAAPTQSAQTFATDVGEQHSFKLADGSAIHLNTNSEVHVRYTARIRDVQLTRGEAFFTVEHDPDRPFRVSAGTAVIHAVGTEFDVYRQSVRTVVAVVKGEVNVLALDPKHVAAPGEDPASPADSTPAQPQGRSLSSGEQVSVGVDGQIRKDTLRNFQPAQYWEQRRLNFNDATLADVAAEFNRYNRAQIVVEGNELRATLITGTFSVDNPEALSIYIQKRDGHVVVEPRAQGFVIRSRPRERS